MIIEPYNDEFFMKEAIKEAMIARHKNEVPVGAVIVFNNRIISRGHNLTETLNDVTAHAEMQAFTSAADFIGGKYLKDCTLYVTLEPCIMCAGAAYWTQIEKVVFGAYDDKRGFQRAGFPLLHPSTEVVGGVLEEECRTIIQQFFQEKRNLNK